MFCEDSLKTTPERGVISLRSVGYLRVSAAVLGAALPVGACARRGYRAGVNRRSRRLLLTTNAELKAIAAPAISGLSRPAAASGNAATL